MRFGLNTFLVSPEFTDADLPLIATFEKYGAQLVELAIVEPASVSVSKLKAALASSSLEQPVICGAFGSGRDLRGSPSEVKNATHYVSELIEINKYKELKETKKGRPKSPFFHNCTLVRLIY